MDTKDITTSKIIRIDSNSFPGKNDRISFDLSRKTITITSSEKAFENKDTFVVFTIIVSFKL